MKILRLFLSVAVMVAIAACGSSSEKNENNGGNDNSGKTEVVLNKERCIELYNKVKNRELRSDEERAEILAQYIALNREYEKILDEYIESHKDVPQADRNKLYTEEAYNFNVERLGKIHEDGVMGSFQIVIHNNESIPGRDEAFIEVKKINDRMYEKLGKYLNGENE